MSIYNELKKLGVQIKSRYSDLYAPATKEVVAVLKSRGAYYETFMNQVEGGLWVDVPGAYTPYWFGLGVESQVGDQNDDNS